MPTASLVVLNWRAEDLTARCVRSLYDLKGAAACEIIVVDNESTPESRQRLAALGDVTVVPLASNRGFAGGMNAGIAAARGHFVALFNNDLVVDSAWLEEALRVMEDPSAGIAGGASLAWDGQQEPPPASAALAMVKVDPERGFAVLGKAPQDERVVAGVDGSNLMARAELLHKLGGFDPRYFAYGEDVDLCARAWALGYATVFSPLMRVWHCRGASSDRVARQRAFWSARNHMVSVAKHFPEASWQRTVGAVALEYLSDALVGHTGGVRAREHEHLSWEQRLGRGQAALWAATNARELAARRKETIAAGHHDEAYVERLHRLAAG